jgi:hypothetical protein
MAEAETLTGQSFWFILNLATVKVSGEQTGDAWSMVELVGPHGDMPPCTCTTPKTRRSTSSKAA